MNVQLVEENAEFKSYQENVNRPEAEILEEPLSQPNVRVKTAIEKFFFTTRFFEGRNKKSVFKE